MAMLIHLDLKICNIINENDTTWTYAEVENYSI